MRLHGRPLGLVDLPLAPGGLSPDGCARLVWSELRAEIAAHLAGDGLAPVTTLTADGLPTGRGPAPCAAAHGAARARGRTEPMSVVIATRDRPGPLARCLASVARLDHPAFEVIVVDNAPATTATRDLVAREHPEVRYVREDRPGWPRRTTAGSPRRAARSSRSRTTTSPSTRGGCSRSRPASRATPASGA